MTQLTTQEVAQPAQDFAELCMDSAVYGEVVNTVLCQELSAAFAKVADHMRNKP
jgi:hypothetical protein